MNNKLPSYISVWNKYLPAIRILLKKSATEGQVLGMNRIDFERAGGIRKSGYRFFINFIKDKPDMFFSGNDLVHALVTVLVSDAVIHEHLLKSNYSFTLTGKYQLQIKNNSLHKQAESSEPVEEEVMVG